MQMKTIFHLLILLSMTTFSFSQEMSVKSFKKLSDMDARINFPTEDANGDKCAIIKVVTSHKGFAFEGDGFGIAKTVAKVGEIWVYVPYGAKRLTIKHADLGVLRNYVYPLPVEEATSYELKLVTGKVQTIVQNSMTSQWVIITSEPSGAMVYINNNLEGTTPFKKKMKQGSYTYRLEADMHHNYAGSFDVDISKKSRLECKLKPSYGYLNIKSLPVSGAKVLIDSKPGTLTTPCTTPKLASGKHKVTLLHDYYKATTVEAIVYDNKTTPVTIDMKPVFSNITVKAPHNLGIYVNGDYKDKSEWTGKLKEGIYTIETKSLKYHCQKQEIEVVSGIDKTYTLKALPKFGVLDIDSDPFDADIYLNGVHKGKTPNTISNLLVGDYTLELKKSGCASIKKNVTIVENQTLSLSEKLETGWEITITSTPSGAKVYIDNASTKNSNSVFEVTPFTKIIPFGKHTVKVEKDGETDIKEINVIKGGNNSFHFNVEKFKNISQKIGKTQIDMIAVKGGIFKMGNDGEYNEKPSHDVKLPDFYIGKYEVTQAQWKEIMGSNPSKSKRDDLPVEYVSWDDIQEFIKKLNRKTGLKYRLPTEAEWEYAARGGNKSSGYKYSGSNKIFEVAWYYKYSFRETHTVGGKMPNELGIYDMSGNVLEWCNDWYDKNYYSLRIKKNPQGPYKGSTKILRGGYYDSYPNKCRVTYRGYSRPYSRGRYIGFRLARSY